MTLRKQFETETNKLHPNIKDYDYDNEGYSDDVRVYLESYIEWLEAHEYNLRTALEKIINLSRYYDEIGSQAIEAVKQRPQP